MSTEKPKTVQINFGIPAWLDEKMRIGAPIRRRGDLEKFFTKLLIEKFGDQPQPNPPVTTTNP